MGYVFLTEADEKQVCCSIGPPVKPIGVLHTFSSAHKV